MKDYKSSYDNIFQAGNLDSPEWLYSFIQPESTVLDVGCSTGNLGERLIQDKRCRVTGLDFDSRALKKAAEKLHETILLDLEREYYHDFSGLRTVLNERRFDYIVMGDIYEHLKNGPSILMELASYLEPQGQVAISIPNIQHFICRRKMLFGSFHYQNEGILDATHCRFFTISSFYREMQDLGFDIDEMKYVGKLFFNHRALLYYLMRCFLPTRKMYCWLQHKAARFLPSLFAFQSVALMHIKQTCRHEVEKNAKKVYEK